MRNEEKKKGKWDKVHAALNSRRESVTPATDVTRLFCLRSARA